MRRILVTGGTGFVGRHLIDELSILGIPVKSAVRSGASGVPPAVGSTVIGEIGPTTDWTQALRDTDVVVHLAGAAHLSKGNEATFMTVNAEGTAALARAAGRASVKRMIFVSSIAVNGSTTEGRPFTEDDVPRPQGHYGLSKLDAEQRLRRIAEESGMEWCIIRPPMVYGTGARGNFARLVSLVKAGWPLPLGCATALRSFISVQNLASGIARAIDHPSAANAIFLISDGEDVSVVGMVQSMASALGTRVRLVAVPKPLMRTAGFVLGRGDDISRLFEQLRMDSSRIRTELDWIPPLTFDAGVRRALRRPI